MQSVGDKEYMPATGDATQFTADSAHRFRNLAESAMPAQIAGRNTNSLNNSEKIVR